MRQNVVSWKVSRYTGVLYLCSARFNKDTTISKQSAWNLTQTPTVGKQFQLPNYSICQVRLSLAAVTHRPSAWQHHYMESLSLLLTLCVSKFPHKGPLLFLAFPLLFTRTSSITNRRVPVIWDATALVCNTCYCSLRPETYFINNDQLNQHRD